MAASQEMKEPFETHLVIWSRRVVGVFEVVGRTQDLFGLLHRVLHLASDEQRSERRVLKVVFGIPEKEAKHVVVCAGRIERFYRPSSHFKSVSSWRVQEAAKRPCFRARTQHTIVEQAAPSRSAGCPVTCSSFLAKGRTLSPAASLAAVAHCSTALGGLSCPDEGPARVDASRRRVQV